MIINSLLINKVVLNILIHSTLCCFFFLWNCNVFGSTDYGGGWSSYSRVYTIVYQPNNSGLLCAVFQATSTNLFVVRFVARNKIVTMTNVLTYKYFWHYSSRIYFTIVILKEFYKHQKIVNSSALIITVEINYEILSNTLLTNV